MSKKKQIEELQAQVTKLRYAIYGSDSDIHYYGGSRYSNGIQSKLLALESYVHEAIPVTAPPNLVVTITENGNETLYVVKQNEKPDPGADAWVFTDEHDAEHIINLRNVTGILIEEDSE